MAGTITYWRKGESRQLSRRHERKLVDMLGFLAKHDYTYFRFNSDTLKENRMVVAVEDYMDLDGESYFELLLSRGKYAGNGIGIVRRPK